MSGARSGRRRAPWLGAVVVSAVMALCAAPASSQTPERIGEIRVHGNHTTPDADVLGLAGLAVGVDVTDALLRQAQDRLDRSGRFAAVEVRKRFRSIDDPHDVLVILLVDEHAAVSADVLTPGPIRRLTRSGMWLPVINYADGYGFTYGARISFVGVAGTASRLSIPLTWGGERRAGVELVRTFAQGPLTRLEATAAIFRRENPHFRLGDRREELRLRGERAVQTWFRVGADARVTTVTFAGSRERHIAPAFDVTFDTRLDPAFPRNAVHVVVRGEQLRFDGGSPVARWTTDTRGYLGLYRSAVLALRAHTIQASAPLPRYEQALLGGTPTMRGFDFGYRTGDNLALLSAEVRVPFTSPLSFGRLGVRAFVDAGTVYAAGTPLDGRRFDRGAGAGVFFTAPFVHMALDVAWPRAGSAHVHGSLGVTF